MSVQKKKLSLTTWIILATIGGLIFGSLVGPWAGNVKFIGTIFIRLIQMSVVPLVMTSVAGSLAGIQGKGAGKMGFTTFVCIVVFTLIAAGLGLALGMIVKPGIGINIGTVASTAEVANTSIQTTLTNFVSTNIFSAMAAGDMVPSIVFSILFGVCAGAYARQTENPLMLDILKQANGIVMGMITVVMKLAPVGIFFLLADVAGTTGFTVILPMLKFLLCLLIGDVIQMVLFGSFTAAFCGVSPLRLPQKFAKVSLMAIATTSSAICLPTEMDDMVNKFGVDKKVADFVGPVAMSMNSTGAVQCYVLAILFMSQATGMTLTPSQLGLSILLACLMCMGTIVVPGGMIVTYTFFAATLGLPTEAVAILIAIDWFSGMFRTVINVDVDIMVGMIASKVSGAFHKDIYNSEAIQEAQV
ncbi:dicarboxylate/amino acid:cation symporter [Oscillospiraceae bacterium MB08-C2-2]|nr:dicarboxylate/amino acid:cation symporter [Oscillospiraceae bacterium MB08-C2-2]